MVFRTIPYWYNFPVALAVAEAPDLLADGLLIFQLESYEAALTFELVHVADLPSYLNVPVTFTYQSSLFVLE